MARGRRRGPSLLIPMIVLVLLTMGLVYWATTIAEERELKEQELAQAEVVEYTTRVREDEALVRLEQSTEHLGYRGGGSLANPHSINRTLEQFRTRVYQYYDVDPSQSQSRLDLRRGGLELGDPQTLGDQTNVAGVIHRQDVLINQVLEANRDLQLAILAARRNADEQYAEQVEEIARAERNRDREIEHAISGDPANPYDPDDPTSPPNLVEVMRESDMRAGEISQNDQQLIDMYRRLWSSESSGLPDMLNRLRDARRDAERLKERVASEVEELEQALFDTILARSSTDHYDGEVWWVDMSRRRAYINLGQRDNVMPGMTFEVERLRRTEAPMPLGMVTVLNVIGPYTAECEISLLRDEEAPIMKKDKVIARNFMRDVKPRFALVGQFGGSYTRFSRAETEEMLRQAGYSVDSEITRHTDVVVLGVGFRDDTQYQRLVDDGDLSDFEETYQYWVPARVYYLLGFSD